jgi:hypothetical protein
MQLNLIGKEKTLERVMRGERKPAEDECEKHYPKSRSRSWGSFWSGHADFSHVILQ